MFLADAAAQTVTLTKGDWSGIGVLVFIGFVIFMASSGSTAQPLSDDEVKQEAEEAGVALRKLWVLGNPGSAEAVSLADHFASKPYGSSPHEVARVAARLVEIGAIPEEQKDGSVCYKPSEYLRDHETRSLLRQISEKERASSVHIGDGSAVNIGDNNVMTNVSARGQVTEITFEQSQHLNQLARDLSKMADRLNGEEKLAALDLHRELEEATLKKDAAAVPGLAKRIKDLVERLPKTQPYIASVSSGLNVIQQIMGFFHH